MLTMLVITTTPAITTTQIGSAQTTKAKIREGEDEDEEDASGTIKMEGTEHLQTPTFEQWTTLILEDQI